jgi:hypothetical protein
VLVFAASLLSACSTKLNLGDYLPEWAGGTSPTGLFLTLRAAAH